MIALHTTKYQKPTGKGAKLSRQCVSPVDASQLRPSGITVGIAFVSYKVMSYAPLDDRRQRGKTTEIIDSYEEEHQIYRSSPTANGLSEPLRLSDPFYVLREELSRKMDSVDESLAEYLRIVFHTVR